MDKFQNKSYTYYKEASRRVWSAGVEPRLCQMSPDEYPQTLLKLGPKLCFTLFCVNSRWVWSWLNQIPDDIKNVYLVMNEDGVQIEQFTALFANWRLETMGRGDDGDQELVYEYC